AVHQQPLCAVLCLTGFTGGGMNGASGTGGGSGDSGYRAQLALLQAWDAANPRSSYPNLSDDQYQSLRYHAMAAIGMITQAVADGMDMFLAWRAANPPSAHPELSAQQWAQLVGAAYLTYVASAEGGGP